MGTDKQTDTHNYVTHIRRMRFHAYSTQKFIQITDSFIKKATEETVTEEASSITNTTNKKCESNGMETEQISGKKRFLFKLSWNVFHSHCIVYYFLVNRKGFLWQTHTGVRIWLLCFHPKNRSSITTTLCFVLHFAYFVEYFIF